MIFKVNTRISSWSKEFHMISWYPEHDSNGDFYAKSTLSLEDLSNKILCLCSPEHGVIGKNEYENIQ